MENCIFCKIIKGEIPSTKVYEDEATLAFLDINPNSIGQTLVIPKEHSENIYTINDESLCTLIKSVKKVATAVKKALGAQGVNILMNNDKDAGQEIFHSHIHIIPRFQDDGFQHGVHKKYEDGQKEEIAEKIRENFHPVK